MTTQYCGSCCGVIALTGHPDSPVRWCQCGRPHDFKDAEIARLRALVKEAYEEGGEASACRGYLVPEDWETSKAKKAMESP